jgi:hypothetical protein
MAQAGVELQSDLAGSVRMSQAARAVAETHTWERCGRDAQVFYEQLLSLGRRP